MTKRKIGPLNHHGNGLKPKPIEEVVENLLRKATPLNDCLVCHLAPNRKGYIPIQPGGRSEKKLRAHRLVYSIKVKPIPEGLIVLHICHNRACINPSHLYLGTPAQNTRDMLLDKRGANQWGIYGGGYIYGGRRHVDRYRKK